MKRFPFLFALILSLFLLTGCTQSPPPDVSAPELDNSSLYCEATNLAGDSARDEVDALMESAGISTERRENLWSHVEQFREAVDTASMLDEFQQVDLFHPEYDPYRCQDEWMEAHPAFNGYNCRITAFSLFGDSVTVDDESEIRDDELFLDLESLEADDSALMGQSLDTFRRLYSKIPTENTQDVTVHQKKIMEDWAERGIRFAEHDRLSLVTVWFHNQWSEEENELFIGHVGTLLDTDNGLYFVEKIAFQEPYQVTHFENREELSRYLTVRYGTEWGQSTAHPFLMENDQPFNP